MREGQTLASGGGDATIRLWDVSTSSRVEVSLVAHSGEEGRLSQADESAFNQKEMIV